MNKLNNLISIVVPVYNEGDSIRLLINEIINVMQSNQLLFELIIVHHETNPK